MSKEVGETGSVEGRGTGRGIGADGGSPEGDWSRADGAAAGAGSLAPGQRWSASRSATCCCATAWRIAGGAVP